MYDSPQSVEIGLDSECKYAQKYILSRSYTIIGKTNLNIQSCIMTDSYRRSELKRVAFYGRTLLEYLMMFGIDDLTSLKNYNTVLDCPAGASSFVAEATQYKINAVGCDPLFGKDANFLCEQGKKDIEYVVKRVSETPDQYNWDFYTSLDKLRDFRKLALRQFISDYDQGIKDKRYIEGKLPKLPFSDKIFELVLSGHFLFTYSHKFNYRFILSSILDLLRVSSREVRIYPIQKSSLEPYEHMPKLLDTLKGTYGINYNIVAVPFEFQKGSNKMLLLSH